jgi:hypothetical protein
MSIYLTVEAHLVVEHLKRGWMVLIPARPHPGGDA